MVVVTRKTAKAAVMIQRCARKYMSKNLMRSLTNKDDSDPITLEPVRDIPRDRLFVLRMNGKRYGYDAFSWLQSIVLDRRHPSTREILPMTAVHSCYATALKAYKNRPEDTPQPVKDAIEKMRLPVSLVHIEQRPAPKRKFVHAQASPRAFRWLLLLRVSPLYTLTSIKVYGKMNTPMIEYGIEDSRKNQAFEASSSSILARSNQDKGLVALASDAAMARDAVRVLADLEGGYVGVSELNGFEQDDEEEEDEEELEEEGNETDGSWQTTDDDDSDFEP